MSIDKGIINTKETKEHIKKIEKELKKPGLMAQYEKAKLADYEDLANDDADIEHRVKNLDKADIESLGFKFVYEEESVLEFSNKEWELCWCTRTNTVELNREENYDDPDYYRNNLEFVIKNKSELKTLLKQLNIE